MATIALAQLNPHVGAIVENGDRILTVARRSIEAGADLVLTPELSLCGYPPEDLLLRQGFLDQIEEQLERLRQQLPGIAVVVGHPCRGDGGVLYNGASVLYRGELIARYHKQELPNYGVFDEKRYFQPGTEVVSFSLAGERFALTICEDLWHDRVIRQCVDARATVVLNLNASPYQLDKQGQRESLIRRHAAGDRLTVVYVNQVGGQDELVFDGCSFVMGIAGEVRLRAPAFEESLLFYDTTADIDERSPRPQEPPESELYRAVVLAVRDYVDKNRFPEVVIGLSGGIDSALTLAIAVDALGAERVTAVSMPSDYTASMSVEDARIEAERLGVEFQLIPIQPLFSAFLGALADTFAETVVDSTEENIQARCRGVILMALANKRNAMVLTTGNKSEMAVGYATLYGDMAGGYAPLKDLSKGLVYRLAVWRNREAQEAGELEVVPRRVIDRPPSAELAPGQQDSDSLPPYDQLDAILERYVERQQCPQEIIAAGFDREVVARVVGMVDRNEYKRRQAPPGARVTSRAFGRDRRFPLTSGFVPRSGNGG